MTAGIPGSGRMETDILRAVELLGTGPVEEFHEAAADGGRSTINYMRESASSRNHWCRTAVFNRGFKGRSFTCFLTGIK